MRDSSPDALHACLSLRRRAFLQTCLGSLAGLSFSPACLRAAGQRLPRLSFAIISDTHLGYQDKDSAARQFEQLVKEFPQDSRDPVLHLGDIVDGGREAQYPVYLELKKKLGRPVHEIPGNHDPAEAFARHVREKIDTVVDHHWLRLVLLNNARRDSHHGFVSEEQVELIDRTCREAAGRKQFVAVCMHVPAHSNRHPDRGWFVQPDDGQRLLYAALDKHRDRVIGLLHGHFHNGLRGWNDRGSLLEVCFPSALYNRDRRLQEQQAPGYNLPEFRPGYTQATIVEGQVRLAYKPLGAAVEQQKSLPLVGA